MNTLFRDKLKKFALFAAVILSVLAGVLFSYWLAFFLLPFLISFLLSSIMEPLIKLLNTKLHISRKVSAPVLLLLLLAILALLLVMAVIRIIKELKVLVATVPALLQTLYKQILAWMDQGYQLFDWLPVGITDNLGSVISNISSTITNLGTSIVKGAFATAISFPEALVFTLITIMATYFMTSDRDRISRALVRQLPASWVNRLLTIKRDMFSALFGYLRAALIIMTITFAELFIGFTVIGVGYPLLLAFIIAIIDALPVLGTGGVLIPWAVYSFVTNDIRMGISILVLYIVVLAIRQIVEPKVVGHQIGVYPLLTLIAMYFGLQLIGFAGLILGPITFLLIRNIIIMIYKNKTFKDIIGYDTKEPEAKKEPEINNVLEINKEPGQ